ncbi:MAG: zinc ABC transporter substrate-binding protein [Anaerolineae bacterium]|nr:zinc ABC transporter substrate-binding protein [Phycisphaerae bacterium]
MAHLRTLFIAVLTVCALQSAGCEKPQASAVSTEPVRVFATVHTVADLARQVGGKYVEVDFAIEGGRSLLGFQPGAAVMQQKNRAQIVIAGGSEPWAVADASNPLEPARVIRLDALRGAPASQPTPGQNEDAQIGLEWLDPVIGQRAAEELARRLKSLRPNHQVYFDARAKQVTEQLEALVKEYQPKFRDAKRRRVMSLTHEFDYLAERFGVDIVHVVGTTVDRIGDQQVATLQRASRDEHLVTLIVRADTSPGLIQDLAKRTGFRIITMDPYGSSSANGRDSYLSLLRYNLDRLLDALNSGN